MARPAQVLRLTLTGSCTAHAVLGSGRLEAGQQGWQSFAYIFESTRLDARVPGRPKHLLSHAATASTASLLLMPHSCLPGASPAAKSGSHTCTTAPPLKATLSHAASEQRHRSLGAG